MSQTPEDDHRSPGASLLTFGIPLGPPGHLSDEARPGLDPHKPFPSSTKQRYAIGRGAILYTTARQWTNCPCSCYHYVSSRATHVISALGGASYLKHNRVRTLGCQCPRVPVQCPVRRNWRIHFGCRNLPPRCHQDKASGTRWAGTPQRRPARGPAQDVQRSVGHCKGDMEGRRTTGHVQRSWPNNIGLSTNMGCLVHHLQQVQEGAEPASWYVASFLARILWTVCYALVLPVMAS